MNNINNGTYGTVPTTVHMALWYNTGSTMYQLGPAALSRVVVDEDN